MYIDLDSGFVTTDGIRAAFREERRKWWQLKYVSVLIVCYAEDDSEYELLYREPSIRDEMYRRLMDAVFPETQLTESN